MINETYRAMLGRKSVIRELSELAARMAGEKNGPEEIFDFIRDFRIVKVSDRKFINLARSSNFIKALASKSRLPLTSYFLTFDDIKNVLCHRF